MIGEKEGSKLLTGSTNLQRSIIFADKINVNKTLKEMLQNFPPMPLPQRQLEGFYSQYLNWNKIVDDGLEILESLKEANNCSVLEKFGEWVRELLGRLRKFSDSGQGMGLDIKQLQKLLFKNLPEFVGNKNQDYKQKITETIQNCLCKQSLHAVEYNNSKIVIFVKPEQRSSLMFGIILQYTHGIILKYKDYYSLEDVSLLQMTIYECFGELVENNKSQCELMKKSVQEKGKPQVQSKKQRLLNFVFKTIAQTIQKPKEVKDDQQKSAIKLQQQKPRIIIKEPKVVDQLIDLLVKQAEQKQMIQKINSQKQQFQRQDKYQQLSVKIRNYEIKPVELIQKGSSLLPSLTTKKLANVIAMKLNEMRDKSTRYEQMSEQEEQKVMKLAQTILKSHIRHNVHRDEGLSAEDFMKVEGFINKNQMRIQPNDNVEMVRAIFTQNQKQLLVEILYSVRSELLKSNSSQHLIATLKHFTDQFSALQVVDMNKSNRLSVKKGITTTLSKVKSSRDESLPNVFYFLLVLFQHLKGGYCPLIRRTLLKICHKIQLNSRELVHRNNGENNRFSLVHTLKLLQSHNIRRSDICNIITNQKPFRQKQLPLVNQKEEYFEETNYQKLYSCDEAQKHLEWELSRIHIFQFDKCYKDPPKMQLLKLSHSKHKKNVTILISGFMSEDTNKFQEWMGVLQPTYDSEIYALQWESKTMQNILEYVITACKDLAFTGAGIGLLGGPYIRAALLLKQIVTKFHQNPFRPCFDVATITGVYFAQLIMKLFDGHFINLIGFSLGTQVMASALEHLKRKGKLQMINRVITLGGVADKDEMINLFETQQQSKQQPISISWTNVYCQSDNILRYLLKISMPSIDPIGLKEINYPEYSYNLKSKENNSMKLQSQHEKMEVQSTSTQKIYEIENVNVTEFVDGHLTYRCNMRSIARLLGIKDE